MAGPAIGEPYRSESSCGPSAEYHSTTRLAAFVGHYVDVSERICTNGSFIKWATNPHISFPTRSVASIGESVSIGQKPFIYSKAVCWGRQACRITWRFTAQHTVVKIPNPSELIFYYRIWPGKTQLCLGKTCVSKAWTYDG